MTLSRLFPIVLVVLSACGASAISLRSGPRSFTATDYEHIYKAWTRSEEDFEWARLSDVLRVAATFEAGRAAYGGSAQSTQIVKLLEDRLGTDLRAAGFPARLE